jgi:hypothetical protein
MDIERIRELRLAQPFKPFYLIMVDGRNLPVDRAIYLGISPARRELAYARVEGGIEFIAIQDVRDVRIDENIRIPLKTK